MGLKTFVLVNQDKVVSPLLVTTRGYGDWLEKAFNSTIAQMELYIPSKKADGSTLLERHPGTRIGKFFKDTPVNDDKLVSWLIPTDGETVKRLIKYGLLDSSDTRNGVRTYTVDQIQFYINSTIDRSFKIADECMAPRQIRVSDAELASIIKPQLKTRNKKLF